MTYKHSFPLRAALLAAALAAPYATAADNAAQSVAPDQALIALGPVPQMHARAAVDTAAFPPLEAKVREAARQGPEALRRYIHRTRMIYNYYYPDFADKSW